MSRLPRCAFETEFFHVIVQGINKEDIFSAPHFKERYMQLVVDRKQEFEVKLLAYCVMDNHCHMLLHVPDVEALGEFMRKVNTMYAQYYNYIKQRVGYVFRDRYKSQAIMDEQYLVNCTLYIQNNPVKAGIVQNPLDYAMDSMRDYILGSGRVDFDDAKEFMPTSPKDMLELMEQYSAADDEMEWIDIKDEQPTDSELFAKAVETHRGDAAADLVDKKTAKVVAREMSGKGMKVKAIAQQLGKTRQTVANWLKE